AALGRELRASNGDARSGRHRTGTEGFRTFRPDGKSLPQAVSRANLRYRAARFGVVTLLRRPGRSSRSLRPKGYPESLSCRRANRSRLALRLGACRPSLPGGQLAASHDALASRVRDGGAARVSVLALRRRPIL